MKTECLSSLKKKVLFICYWSAKLVKIHPHIFCLSGVCLDLSLQSGDLLTHLYQTLMLRVAATPLSKSNTLCILLIWSLSTLPTLSSLAAEKSIRLNRRSIWFNFLEMKTYLCIYCFLASLLGYFVFCITIVGVGGHHWWLGNSLNNNWNAIQKKTRRGRPRW